MKTLLIAFACIALLTIPAVAQQADTPMPPAPRRPLPPPQAATAQPEASPAAQPATQQQIVIPETYNIVLTPQEVDQIGAAINELPARIANPMAHRIQNQINAQMQEATRKAAEAKAEPKK